MSPVNDLIAAAKVTPKRIVLAEGADPRILDAAVRAAKDGLASPILVGPEAEIRQGLSDRGIGDDLKVGSLRIEIADPATSPLTEGLADLFHTLRQHKGVDREMAAKVALQPLAFSALMVKAGHADGTIGGAVETTEATVRAALQIIGRGPGVKTVSSFFLMVLDKEHHPKQEVLIFSDCGMNIEPDPAGLAQIATASATSYRGIMNKDPRVAMLSFSTMGSANHERAQAMGEATRLAKEIQPDLAIDGEMQFDAAFVPAIAEKKAPDSDVAGSANVFIFPNLEAANIGYKIAERIGGATAIGPILQGLDKPANDLSRGCSADDVYIMMAVTAVQAG